MDKPRVGISACLLGEKVRHNGESKKNDWLVDRLSQFVTWVPVCPEVEMGLGVPRETMHLERTSLDQVRLMTHKSQRDLTALAGKTARMILSRDLDVDAFILKKDSPSCGLERVKVYDGNRMPTRAGTGFFAQALLAGFPQLLMIEEGRLCDARQREHFVVRLFAAHRLRQVGNRVAEIQKFHQAHKLILMAHSPTHYQRAGVVAANQERLSPAQAREAYRSVFLEGINVASTPKKWVNVLQHMLGYFKDKIDAAEKKQLLGYFDDYRDGELPLLVPLTMIGHLSKKFSVEYLKGQRVFDPYPKGLGLLDSEATGL